jgi:hypothetical protein
VNAPAELLLVARRVVWFKEPQETITDKAFFLAHVMTYGTLEDVLTARKYFSSADFVEALRSAPAGIFDPRSWAYWNTIMGRLPVPPLPSRSIAG